MKRLFTIIAVAVIAIVIVFLSRSHYAHHRDQQAAQYGELPITVVFLQDVSGSIKSNGVEIVPAAIFNPYFSQTDRDINLYFGFITGASSKKLLHVFLAAATFKKPATLNANNFSIAEKQKDKENYIHDLNTYRLDSINYFQERNNQIVLFKHEVDSTADSFRKSLTNKTDLITSLAIAAKAFNFTGKEKSKNYLIVNSDAEDSYHRLVKEFNKNVIVILVNADGSTHTSIDSILTTTVESPEQAIAYSLNN